MRRIKIAALMLCLAISKGSIWDYNTVNYTVHCTDGDIAKSNS